MGDAEETLGIMTRILMDETIDDGECLRIVDKLIYEYGMRQVEKEKIESDYDARQMEFNFEETSNVVYLDSRR